MLKISRSVEMFLALETAGIAALGHVFAHGYPAVIFHVDATGMVGMRGLHREVDEDFA